MIPMNEDDKLMMGDAMGQQTNALIKAQSTMLLALIRLLIDRGVLTETEVRDDYLANLVSAYAEIPDYSNLSEDDRQADVLERAFAESMIGKMRLRLGME
jgi:hypothetical protein